MLPFLIVLYELDVLFYLHLEPVLMWLSSSGAIIL
jgi:hypothetical protein